MEVSGHWRGLQMLWSAIMEEVSRLQALLCSSVPFVGSHSFQGNQIATLGDSSVESAFH